MNSGLPAHRNRGMTREEMQTARYRNHKQATQGRGHKLPMNRAAIAALQLMGYEVLPAGVNKYLPTVYRDGYPVAYKVRRKDYWEVYGFANAPELEALIAEINRG